jgi:arylsulfatase A-like enzyme
MQCEARALTRSALALVVLLGCSCNISNAASEKSQARSAPAASGAPAVPAAPAPAPLASGLTGPHHPVFSLLDNRLLAHLIRDGGLLVPLGQPGAAKYVNFGRPWTTWRLGVKEEGKPVALAIRNVTWLRVPLTEAQAKSATVLSLSVKSARPQGLSVKLNQTKLKPAKLNAGWQKVTVEIPSGALWSGENRMELTFSSASSRAPSTAEGGRGSGEKSWAAVEWLHLGSHALPATSFLAPARKHKLVLPAGGGLAYYLHPYKGSKLRLRFAAPAPAARCDVRARLASQGAKAVEVRAEGKPVGPEQEAVVDLAPIADRVGRLDLVAEGAGCKELELSDAAVVLPGPEPKLKRGKAPKHVLFWMIDNARADRFTLYNPGTRVQTPVITELGKTGTVFARAYVQGNESRVSHGSIWTSAYPRQARFIDPKAKLNLAWETMPEAVKKAGYYTAAWIANGFISKFWGFAEGFNLFHNYLHEKAEFIKPSPLSAEGLANFAIRFLEKPLPKDKTFIYVGTIDPHVSWRGRQPWLKQYYPEAYNGTFEKDVLGPIWEKIATGSRNTSPEDKKRIIAIYDSTVSYNDKSLGKLLGVLKDKGLRDDTMIIITADHGEELWDHGRAGHGSSIRQELVAVPLVIHYPPLFGKGVVVKQGVDTLSIMPTILDAIGGTIPDTVQGESLLPLAQGIGTGYPRPSIASQYELAHAMRLERWKLRIGGKGEAELWDLDSKKGEHAEIAVSHPNEVRWLTDALSTWLTYQDRWRSTRWGVASNHTAALAEDLETGGGPVPIRVGRPAKE